MQFLKRPFFSKKSSSASDEGRSALSIWPILQDRRIQIVVYLVIALVHIFLVSAPFMRRLEFLFLDTFFRMRPALEMSSDIVIVEIAQDSIQKIGRWPWPRHYHAALVSILKEWNARAVVFDAFFSEPSLDKFDDDAFVEALAQGGNVYAGVVTENVLHVKDGAKIASAKTWVNSIPAIQEKLKGVGHVNVRPDVDGISRRVEISISQNGEAHRYLGVDLAEEIIRPLSQSMVTAYPLDDHGMMLINWAGIWEKSFQHFSYWDILQSYAAIKEGKSPIIRPEELKGKTVLIGMTASGLTDIKVVPIQSVFPGVGVIATVMNSILTNQFVREANYSENTLMLLLIALGMGIWFWNASGVSSWAGAFLIAGGWVVLAFFIFIKGGIYFQIVNPLLLIFGLSVVSILIGFLRNQNERSLLYQLATRDGLTGLYVIRYMRSLLHQAYIWGLKKKHSVSVMMVDIDFFKKINDGYGHDAGDCILRDVARLMDLELSEQNHAALRIRVGRYGGEEFIALIEDCDIEVAAERYAESVRRRIEAFQFRYQGKQIGVTISIGVGALEESDKSMDEAIKRADRALYRAKEGGRNQVQIGRTSDPEIEINPSA